MILPQWIGQQYVRRTATALNDAHVSAQRERNTKFSAGRCPAAETDQPHVPWLAATGKIIPPEDKRLENGKVTACRTAMLRATPINPPLYPARHRHGDITDGMQCPRFARGLQVARQTGNALVRAARYDCALVTGKQFPEFSQGGFISLIGTDTTARQHKKRTPHQ